MDYHGMLVRGDFFGTAFLGENNYTGQALDVEQSQPKNTVVHTIRVLSTLLGSDPSFSSLELRQLPRHHLTATAWHREAKQQLF